MACAKPPPVEYQLLYLPELILSKTQVQQHLGLQNLFINPVINLKYDKVHVKKFISF